MGQTLSKHIAEHLLEIGAISLRPQEPFTWASGLKSPIYCDNRLTMSYPHIRQAIARGFASLIEEHYGEAEVIAGTATAGIAHAAWVADLLGLPMIYVRDKAKGHGKQNVIEGVVPVGKKVVVIEDLISTGGSALKAALAINESGGHVLGVAAIFTYGLQRAHDNFVAANMPLYTLSNYETMIETAVNLGHLKQEDVQLMNEWRKNNIN